MEDLNFIEAASERDIDLLLLEELSVSEGFAAWLAEKAFGTSSLYYRTLGAWHSVTDPEFGESDVVLIFQATNNKNCAILIENKIDALPQTEQAQRYRRRGEKGQTSGQWDIFKTCIVAPQAYIDKTEDASGYDKAVSYEEIGQWFIDHSSEQVRGTYKSKLISEAIEQNRRGYTMTPDDHVTDFWKKYWEYAESHHPKLDMRRPGMKPAKSDWPDFRPRPLDKRFSIVHKLAKGNVDLQIAGAAEQLEELYDKYQNLLQDDMEFVKAGKSGALRINVRQIDRFGDFSVQREAVEQGMRAAEKLIEVALIIQRDLT